MGFDEELKAKAEQVIGKVKEGAGDATGDERMEAEGKIDQVSGGLKEGWANIKDAARDATS